MQKTTFLREGTSSTETVSSEKVLLKLTGKNGYKVLNISRSCFTQEGTASVRMGKAIMRMEQDEIMKGRLEVIFLKQVLLHLK